MNVLYGLLHPDRGEIVVDGVPRGFRGPRDAIAAGIGMVHQHFMLVPVFTVTDNVMLGAERIRGGPLGMLDRGRARRDVLRVSQKYGLQVDPDAVIEDLPVGVQQRVEIVKALVREVDLLILDEPTAVLTPQETDDLLDVMRSLKAAGKSIVFITHKLKEVKAIADRITVVRRGRTVGTLPPDTSEAELATLMVGRSVSLRADRGRDIAAAALGAESATAARGGAAARPAGAGQLGGTGDVVLDVAGLVVVDDRGHVAVDGVDLQVRAGEVLGVAGVQGNGQTELVEALVGLRPSVAGTATLFGESLLGRRTRDVLGAGVAYIPEDRSVDGLIRDFTVAENLILDSYHQEPFGTRFSLRLGAIESGARDRISEYDVRVSSPDALVATLSGGNQQKLIVAREMSRRVRLLVAAQPTRGVDVGSIEFIHRRMLQERDAGVAVLLVSSELDEVLALSDRIAIMYRGKVLATVVAGTERERIGLLMAGVIDGAGSPQ
jgi:general nucleoside transport system ATP-binding protein